MTVTLVFLALLMAVFAGWLISQSINVRPWVAQAVGTAPSEALPGAATAPRVGLVVFLAVATSLFALTISAYMLRMQAGDDWTPLAEPRLLWLNTGVLALASLALQLAWIGARRGDPRALRRGLIAGGVCSFAFVAGQYAAWQQLQAAGYYASASPAYAFFYLLTGLHALHLLGGLIAWGRTALALRRGATAAALGGAVELCAIYWHYLLVVWAVLFAVILAT